MKTERFKSVVLLLLVTMSFVLTTRIWFDISIGGLFVMPPSTDTFQYASEYDKENLLKPNKLVVHTGLNHTLLFNNIKDKMYYDFILNGSKDVLRDWLNNYGNYSQSSIEMEQLNKIRNGGTVELIFEYPMELSNIKSLLDINKNPWNDIKNITSIVIAPNINKLYIIEKGKNSIAEFTNPQMSGVLSGVIAEVEKRNDSGFVFLNVFNNKDTYKLYGDYAIAPVAVTSMPALTVKKEVEDDGKLVPEIEGFFNDEKLNISSIKDADGKVTFTDREEETVTVGRNGSIEYYKYNVASDNTKFTDVNEAVNIATQYVNQHLGFTYDFYLSDVESRNQGGRTSYIIKYNYKYNGIPVITDLDNNSGSVEVEILGQEVKRYKRDVRIIEDQGKEVQIKSFVDILNIVWGDLDRYLNINKSESIVMLNDIYLAYFERNEALIPVWVVDVKVEGKDKTQYDKKYVIGAEEGVVLDEQ